MSTRQISNTNGLEIAVYKNWKIPCQAQWKAFEFSLGKDQISNELSTSYHLPLVAKVHQHEAQSSQKPAFVDSCPPGMKTDVKVRKFVRKHVRNDYLEKGAWKNTGGPKDHGTNTKTFMKSQSACQVNQLMSIEPMMLPLFIRRRKRFRRFDIPPWEDYRESRIQTSKWTIGRW